MQIKCRPSLLWRCYVASDSYHENKACWNLFSLRFAFVWCDKWNNYNFINVVFENNICLFIAISVWNVKLPVTWRQVKWSQRSSCEFSKLVFCDIHTQTLGVFLLFLPEGSLRVMPSLMAVTEPYSCILWFTARINSYSPEELCHEYCK